MKIALVHIPIVLTLGLLLVLVSGCNLVVGESTTPTATPVPTATFTPTPIPTPTPSPTAAPTPTRVRLRAILPSRFQTPTPTFTPRPSCYDADPLLQVLPSLVEVTAYRSDGTLAAGSGFILDAERGYIVTAHHVIANAFRIEVTLRNGVTNPAEFAGYAKGGDVAFLQAETMVFPALTFPSPERSPEAGDCVYALGIVDGAYVTRGGVVEGFSVDNASNVLAHLDFAIESGMSGGPLVNKAGEVFAIGSLTTTAIALNADSVRDFLDVIEESRAQPKPTPTRTPRPTPTPTPRPPPLYTPFSLSEASLLIVYCATTSAEGRALMDLLTAPTTKERAEDIRNLVNVSLQIAITESEFCEYLDIIDNNLGQ